MIFKQLFEPDSSTYTYLIGCPSTGECLLIDPVLETVERDLAVIQELGLTLRYSLETHIHADHITGGRKLRTLAGSKIAAPALDELPCVDIGVREGSALQIGELTLHPLFTPGHTDSHHAYVIDNQAQKMLFSGDALLIEACGRTDFQSGDAATLYKSIHSKLFNLPNETLVYPGHDYEGRFITTIAQEKQRNPRLGNDKSLEEFVEIMDSLNLPYPRKIDFALPGNRACGECPPNVPDELKGPCELAWGRQG